MPHGQAGQKYVICNSDEAEPGTCKDRELLLCNPHGVLEGIAIAAYCAGASVGYHYNRGEFHAPCREGTGWMYRVLDRIVHGQGTPIDIEHLCDVSGHIEGHTICAFGEAAAGPCRASCELRHEFEYFVEHGHSMLDKPS